ncbi:unnamed protein product, partial [Laminaria digitata]
AAAVAGGVGARLVEGAFSGISSRGLSSISSSSSSKNNHSSSSGGGARFMGLGYIGSFHAFGPKKNSRGSSCSITRESCSSSISSRGSTDAATTTTTTSSSSSGGDVNDAFSNGLFSNDLNSGVNNSFSSGFTSAFYSGFSVGGSVSSPTAFQTGADISWPTRRSASEHISGGGG